MNKKYNLALFTLFVAVLLGTLSVNISAQNKVSADTKQVPMLNSAGGVLQRYIEISSLPMDKRREVFSDLSAQDRANIFKFHLAFQFVKRPGLTNEQKELILESMSMATRDSYDDKKPEKRVEAQQAANVLGQKVQSVFPRREGFEIFASLGGNKEDIEVLQKYQDISKLPSMSERKELFIKSSSVDKSNYWKMHLAYSLVKFSELNNEQKEIILDLISLLKPELYDLKKIPANGKLK